MGKGTLIVTWDQSALFAIMHPSSKPGYCLAVVIPLTSITPLRNQGEGTVTVENSDMNLKFMCDAGRKSTEFAKQGEALLETLAALTKAVRTEDGSWTCNL